MISKKIAMLGTFGVGKTSLVRQFVSHQFDEKYHSTLGVKVDKKVVEIGEQKLNLMLWDIAGTERHFDPPLHYVKGAAAYLLVIDGTREETLLRGVDIAQRIEENFSSLPFITVVNKSDLDWQMSADDITAAFAKYDQQWLATSAKTGENVEAAFTAIAEKLLA